MNSEREVSITVDRKGTCIWTKSEGSEVYQHEEIGFFIVSKDFRMPLRSPIAGTISAILCRGEQEVDGTEQEAPVAIIKQCFHAIVMNNICLNCLGLVDNTKLRSYKQIITYDGCVQYLQKDYYESERLNVQNSLLRNHKLGLVFDLDNTLMEQTDDLQCIDAAQFGIPDVNVIHFVHNDRPTELVVMLRPHIIPVLTELTKYFDLSVYTNGIREYAVEVVRLIDPRGSLFGNRIIARNDIPENIEKAGFSNAEPSSKNMQFVLPGYDTMGVSVDDNVCVWKDKRNVIMIPRFEFWRHYRNCINRLHLRQITDESRRRLEMFNAVGRIVNSSDMDTILNTLLLIHREFYNMVNEIDATKVTHSTGEVIDHVRSNVLKGRVVFFDGSLHDEFANSLNHELHEKVRQLGGKIADVINETVTHVVSKGDKTELIKNYLKYPKYKFVSENWLYACSTFLGLMSSKSYPVRWIEDISTDLMPSTISSSTSVKSTSSTSPTQSDTSSTPSDTKSSSPAVASIPPSTTTTPSSTAPAAPLAASTSPSTASSFPSTTSTPSAVDPDLEDLLSDNIESDCPPPGETIPDEAPQQKRTRRDRDRDRGNEINKEISEEKKREKRKRTLLD